MGTAEVVPVGHHQVHWVCYVEHQTLPVTAPVLRAGAVTGVSPGPGVRACPQRVQRRPRALRSLPALKQHSPKNCSSLIPYHPLSFYSSFSISEGSEPPGLAVPTAPTLSGSVVQVEVGMGLTGSLSHWCLTTASACGSLTKMLQTCSGICAWFCLNKRTVFPAPSPVLASSCLTPT